MQPDTPTRSFPAAPKAGLLHQQHVDGKLYVKERVELAAKQPSFWQDYKFVNPVSKKVEPKQMYCEKLDNTAVCAGIYKL